MRVWQLRKGADKRFRSGHPWVFSNELSASPKGATPGELIELQDANGNFLAYGYGNPRSLIAFRTLTIRQDDIVDSKFFSDRFQRAAALRTQTGVGGSYRLVFAEGDYLPGLIIDRYFLCSSFEDQGIAGQAFVIQASTAGMDTLFPLILEGLQSFVEGETKENPAALGWSQTAVVTANTSRSRELEGLSVEERRVLQNPANLNLESCVGLFQSGFQVNETIPMEFSILNGQKTGFFLDQRENIRQLLEILAARKPQGTIKVLDLCCYVGQWSAQISAFAKSLGAKAECTLFDASEEALKMASENVRRNGGLPISVKGDVLQTLRGTLDRSYDIVICDPPAFIKKKKDLPTGQAAYLKLNKEAIRKSNENGIYVSCSCSGLFVPEDFKSTLARISYNANYRVQWIKSGFHSADHPQRMEFPEGSYLKCLIGVLSSQ